MFNFTRLNIIQGGERYGEYVLMAFQEDFFGVEYGLGKDYVAVDDFPNLN
jgi:hypothetical protein